MQKFFVAAAAVLALAACNQNGGGGPALPQVQAGAQAPLQLTGQTAQQAQLSDAERTQLQQLVAGYLNDVQTNFGAGMGPAQGFTDEVAGLQPETDHRYTVDLVGNTNYRVIGACDNECSNMDIELIDMRTGGVVASDMLPDDYPVVNFTPPANGQYMVRMLMRTCTVAPCYAGARVLTDAAVVQPAVGDKT